ncbi:hypothetical protein [Thermoflexus sp.]|uniref:hypothetical protein n=1 Tax=Thermoflexus sp. TaxID=1969742 RepID=UPI00260A4834|nr:hypothetical protein [Thermoflexus sp.]MCX7689500.1 hypothetical protein [Thermoflexus sp.]
MAFLILTATGFSSLPGPAAAVIGFLLAFSAPFAAEHGVMAGWLILLFVSLSRGSPAASGSWTPYRVAIYGALPFVFFALWLSLSGSPRAIGGYSLPDVMWNGLYLLQGLLSPFIRAVPASWSGSAWKMALAEAGMLASLAIVFWLQKRFPLWLTSVGWYGLAVLPVAISRPFVYVMDGPRLMYLAAAGAAWLWAGVISHLARRRRWGRWAALILAGGILLAHGEFLLELRMQLETGGRLAEETLRQVQEIPSGKTLVFVNYPSWLAASNERYPLGHEGVPLIPDYLGLASFLRANLGRSWTVVELSFPDIMQSWRFRFGTLGTWPGWQRMAEIVQQADYVYIMDYSSGGHPQLMLSGMKAPCSSQLAAFGEGELILCDASIEGSAGEIRVYTTWTAAARIPADWTIFLHLYDPDGRLLAQEDGYLVGRTLPPQRMEPGVSIREIRRLPLSAVRSPGMHRIAIGVYRRETGERLEVHSSLTHPDRALLLGTLWIRK